MFKEHDLKCWPEPFSAAWEFRKGYEIRVNDRNYEVGDRLNLREYNPTTRIYTGRQIIAKVTYMTIGGAFGLPDNLCVLSIHMTQRLAA